MTPPPPSSDWEPLRSPQIIADCARALPNYEPRATISQQNATDWLAGTRAARLYVAIGLNSITTFLCGNNRQNKCAIQCGLHESRARKKIQLHHSIKTNDTAVDDGWSSGVGEFGVLEGRHRIIPQSTACAHNQNTVNRT